MSVWLAALVLSGLWVLFINIRGYLAFEAFCAAVASETRERDALATPWGGQDGGMNGYREALYRDLMKGSLAPALSAEMHQRAAALALRLRRVRALSFAFMAVLVTAGLLRGW
jgi:hypothetical protein